MKKTHSTRIKCFLGSFLVYFLVLPAGIEGDAADSLPTLEELNTISRAQFLDQLEPLFKDEFCQGGEFSFFSRCFTISKTTCNKSVEVGLETCSKDKIKIPAKVNFVLSGTHWAQFIGRCLGETFYLRHKRDFQKDDFCLARNKWL